MEAEAVGTTTSIRTASRLFPAKNWEDEETLVGMMDAVRPTRHARLGCKLQSHWRDALWLGIFGTAWDANNLDRAGVEAVNRKITEDWMGKLRVYGPGGYLNEGDKEVDPTGLFWASTAVGSEEWEVQQGQEEWLTLQTGRLCKKAAW
ncbi:hypothetical protein QBC45DRAFT_441490 [Copromyces sp. CBS 386.78]|nr:hypothetical protein QBC45DRAFT_441490 [Copromyces sp. CBS 386.78]